MDTAVAEPALLTFEETMAILRISENTLRKLIGQGQIKSKRVGRAFRFKRQWIDEYLEEG